MSLRKIVAVLAAVVVMLLAYFVWPTRYRYYHGLPGVSAATVRENRFSGNTSLLTVYGWIPIPSVEQQPQPLSYDQWKARQRDSIDSIRGAAGRP